MANIFARYVLVFSLCVCVSAIMGPGNGTKTNSQKTDTYLDAYSKSRIEAEKAKQGVVIVTAKDGEKIITNRDDSYQPSYEYSAPYHAADSGFSSSGFSSQGPSASNNYLPPSSYGTPIKYPDSHAAVNNYGPPAHTYGPPAQNYGPPVQNYGPPPSNYGPPIQKPLAPIYGPPIKPFFNVPYTAPGLGFLDKLSLKLDILTIAKIMLKLLIFKKIVSMLAVVCLLLFIPKLIHFKKGGNNNYNDEEDRKFGDKNGELFNITKLLVHVFLYIA